MVNGNCYGLHGQQASELIQRYAHFLDHLNGQHRLGPGIKHVVLRECTVRVEGRHRRCRQFQRIQHHHHARNAAERLVLLGQEIASERKISLTRIRIEKQRFSLVRRRTDKRLRQGKRLCSCQCLWQCEANNKRGEPQQGKRHEPVLLLAYGTKLCHEDRCRAMTSRQQKRPEVSFRPLSLAGRRPP
jgi:hypothetical protein